MTATAAATAATTSECVARASCAGCSRAIVVSAPDCYTVLEALMQEREEAAWSLDPIGRRVCPTCATGATVAARRR